MPANVQSEKLMALYGASRDLVSIGDLDMLLKRIMQVVKEICGCEGSAILLVDHETQHLFFKETAGEKGESIREIRLPLDDKKSIAGWCAVHRKAALVNDVGKDSRHAKIADAASGFVTKSILAVPVIWHDKALGVIEAVNKKGGNFNAEDETFLGLLAGQAAVALNTTRILGDLQNFFVHSVELLIELMDKTFPALKGHSSRVARLASGMAREMGIKGKEYENIFYAAYLHDLGKLRLEVPTLKDQSHPVLACRILEPVNLFKDLLPLIRHHHERFDGTGFPDKLKGERIPLGARILAVAEDFDEQGSLINGLEAQRKFYDEFLTFFGTKYDPKLLGAFKKVSEAYFETTLPQFVY